jgi:hypothetical protein
LWPAARNYVTLQLIKWLLHHRVFWLRVTDLILYHIEIFCTGNYFLRKISKVCSWVSYENISHLILYFIFALICVYIGCYVAYGGPAQLLPGVVLSSLDVPTEWDCKAECTRARDSFNFFCTALSFRSVLIQRSCVFLQ